MASFGNKNYRVISVITQYRFSVKVLLDVPFHSFSPQPHVDSVLIEIVPKVSPLSKSFINNIQFLFSFRKKNVSFLMNYLNKSDQINYGSFDIYEIKEKKIWQLPVEQIFELSTFLNVKL